MNKVITIFYALGLLGLVDVLLDSRLRGNDVYCFRGKNRGQAKVLS